MSDTIELQMLDWKYYDETQFSEYKRDGEIKENQYGIVTLWKLKKK
mgnify:CR=1 FL=1